MVGGIQKSMESMKAGDLERGCVAALHAFEGRTRNGTIAS